MGSADCTVEGTRTNRFGGRHRTTRWDMLLNNNEWGEKPVGNCGKLHYRLRA